jgi:hypothetical protein
VRRRLLQILWATPFVVVTLLSLYVSADTEVTSDVQIGPVMMWTPMMGPAELRFRYERRLDRAAAGYAALPKWNAGRDVLGGYFEPYRESETTLLPGIRFLSEDRAHFWGRPPHANQPLPAQIRRERCLCISAGWIYLVTVLVWLRFVYWAIPAVGARRGAVARGFPMDGRPGGASGRAG